jgi:hypothetical protein
VAPLTDSLSAPLAWLTVRRRLRMPLWTKPLMSSSPWRSTCFLGRHLEEVVGGSVQGGIRNLLLTLSHASGADRESVRSVVSRRGRGTDGTLQYLHCADDRLGRLHLIGVLQPSDMQLATWQPPADCIALCQPFIGHMRRVSLAENITCGEYF